MKGGSSFGGSYYSWLNSLIILLLESEYHPCARFYFDLNTAVDGGAFGYLWHYC